MPFKSGNTEQIKLANKEFKREIKEVNLTIKLNLKIYLKRVMLNKWGLV